MNYDLFSAKKQVEYLDNLRLERALQGASYEFKHVFHLISLLLHINHPNLPGYVADAPAGIADFKLSPYQKNYLHDALPRINVNQPPIPSFSYRTCNAILGVYVMGSIASISQTALSDLDIWVCHRENLSKTEKEALQRKADLLQQWAHGFHIEINLYPIDQQRFRCFRYAEPLTAENCGSAQYMLLLEEFYRSAIRLAGKPLLWQHLLVQNEMEYESEVARLVESKQIDLDDWVDFGGLGSFSANEYFGASLWQLYKGIDAPYKSVIKILLLETYSSEYPNTYLIAREFKEQLLTGKLNPSHQFDPYLAMLERATRYLVEHNELKRLGFVRRSVYLKATEGINWQDQNSKNNWRLAYLQKLVKEWGWSDALINELNQRSRWKIKYVKKSHNSLIKFLMLSYRNLVAFARKHHVNSSIMPQDIAVLTRKLYTAFEELPGKITLLNPQIALDLSEKHLLFFEVKNNKSFKDGWYLVNHTPNIEGFSQKRYTEHSDSLNKLVAWAYFNRLLTANTEINIISQRVSLTTLRNFVTDLRLSFPATISSASNENLSHACEISSLMVAINLTVDPTKNLTHAKEKIQASDLFSFGPKEESLVGSIDITYRNLWNEIRTLHFEGQNAILLALKVLSNKIHRGAPSPASVQVFCYSQRYQRTLRNIVTALINRCISIQIGTVSPPKNHLLRVAGKNWQFFFEERGISLQEVNTQNLVENTEFDSTLDNEIEEKESPSLEQSRSYPPEIDYFASEGFLQFFFEDNPNGSFNVYILDEVNRIEIYRQCEGSKEQKIKEINYIYQSSGLEENNNPYKIVQRDFNYPQFYQLLSQENGIKIVPFHSRLAMS
ncbi:class I adenylate cyclase [Pasteurella sp. PK-2025]|uniref:class I adenylate cyclase n=1 Tax=unclassified Pasteurella TaxID=2621516 RepID=UPI003C7607E4